MKKYHLYLWIIALIGMITSCSQNETDALQNANNKMVSITASLPVDFVQPNPQSRAALPEAPDDQYKLRCILEIWDEELTTLKVRKEVCPAAGAEKIDFTFELDNGEYHALLWADYVGKNAVAQATAIAGLSDVQHYADRWYETNNATGLKEVRVMAMDVKFEKQDAFFAAKPFTKEATALKDLAATLTRAVAKLTIAEKSTTNFAYCKSVEFKYNVLTTLDVSTGIVSGTASFANVYGSGNAGFGEDITINDIPCKVLFSNYILANTDGTMPEISLEFAATAESGKVLNKVTIPAGIPIKRNHRINAAGTLILAQDAPSKAVNMTVDIDSEWETTDVEHNIDPIWDGKYPTSVEEAKAWMGTESSGANASSGRDHVFTITAARQLAALHYLMSNNVKMNVTNESYQCATYKLATDIDLNGKDWTPIGYDRVISDFYGVFDGQGHTVRGMNATGDNVSSSGFFARASGRNTIIKHLNIKGRVTPGVTSNWDMVNCGGIVGRMYNGTCIAFCSFEGTISATHPNNGKVHGGGIAGLVGISGSAGKIISCYSVVTEMSLTGTAIKGGIAGYTYNDTTIQGCYWQELAGIRDDSPCGTIENGGGINVGYNGHFTDAVGANDYDVIKAMNTYVADYDYQWQAGTNGSYPVLVKKTVN